MLSINENGITTVLDIQDDKPVLLLHFSSLPYLTEDFTDYEKVMHGCRLVEVQASGMNQNGHHGNKHTDTSPADELRYVRHSDYRNGRGRKLEIEQRGGGLCVTSHLQFHDGVAVVRSWTEISNIGDEPIGLEYVSSFALTGVTKEGCLGWDAKSRLHVPHNTWQGEAQWRSNTISELGLTPASESTIKRLLYSVTGTWTSEGYIPMGILENTECRGVLIWQIEACGSWQWEISEFHRDLYLKLSGPTEGENHWWKNLSPGETFESVPAAVGHVVGGIDDAVGEMTKYRRATRRPNSDNERLPVIFNDFMNCLWADPTTEKEIPLIDAAAGLGCEYYCVDAGWYADGGWWEEVGEWLPSARRFPGGIKEPLDYIREKGMIPGLWLELEVMGINCPLAKRVPDDWFFCRHGKRVIDHGRYQLDFRNPDVRAHADEVIDRLVDDYGVGYIKMDYNIDAGPGTEVGADSFGDGLLGHNRAFIQWLDEVWARHPDLVIELCAAGGLRTSYGYLSRYSIESTSDQSDYRKYPAIVAGSLAAIAPEQAAVWSYPLKGGDREETIFNMVNAMLCRIHQSGNVADLSEECAEIVREAIAYYKSIRDDIRSSLPIWPLGFPLVKDGWVSVGLRSADCLHLAVWRTGSPEQSCNLPLTHLKGTEINLNVGFPIEGDCALDWNVNEGILTVTLPGEYTARVLRIEKA